MEQLHRVDPYVQNNLLRNFTVNILDGTFFMLGMSFSSVVTVMPLFVSQLSDSPLLISLIPAIQNVGWFLPALFTAQYVEKLPRKKPFVLLMTLNERIPFVGMALVALAVPVIGPTLALVLFFLCHIWRTFGGGLTSTPWQDMIGKIIPPRRRGTFYGMQFGFGGLAGAFGAGLAGRVLERYPFSLNFAINFGLTAVAVAFSFIFIALAREKAEKPATNRPQGRAFWASLPVILRQNRNYSNYLVFRVLLVFGAMASAFVTVFGVNKLGITDAQAGTLTLVMMLVETAAYPTFGLLGDHMGHRRTMQVAAVASGLTALFALLAPSADWYLAVYVMLGLSIAATMVSNLSAIYDFCKPEEVPTYVGLTASLVAIPSFVAPVLGGVIASAANYETVFAVAVLFSAASLAMLVWGVREPRHDKRVEAEAFEPAVAVQDEL
ncbi:MAG: MFS transporter [Anaerolineae bacterium]